MVPGGKTAAPAGNDASVGTVSRLLPRANLLDSRSTPTEWKIERLFDQIALDETHRRQARRFENGVDSMTCTCSLVVLGVVATHLLPSEPLGMGLFAIYGKARCAVQMELHHICLLYTSPSPRD